MLIVVAASLLGACATPEASERVAVPSAQPRATPAPLIAQTREAAVVIASAPTSTSVVTLTPEQLAFIEAVTHAQEEQRQAEEKATDDKALADYLAAIAAQRADEKAV
jgi:hypothetical protein